VSPKAAKRRPCLCETRERRWLVSRSLGEGWRLFSTFPPSKTTTTGGSEEHGLSLAEGFFGPYRKHGSTMTTMLH